MAEILQPCLVPGCQQVLVGLRGRAVKVCTLHRDAEEIDINGDAVRYCRVCRTLHPIGLFSTNRRICSAKVASISRGFRSRRTRRVGVRPRLGWMSLVQWAIRQAFSSRPSPAVRYTGNPVWGSTTIAFLKGATPAAKVVLTALYVSACYTLGPHQLETWGGVAVAAVILHLMLPHMHQHHYVRPLQEVREEALQPGLAVSACFQFLDLSERSKYEQHLAKRDSHMKSAGQMIGVSLFTAAMLSTAGSAAQATWGVSRGWFHLFLGLVGAVYCCVRWSAAATERRFHAQLTDAAMLIFGTAVQLLPLIFTWMSGSGSCGLPDAYATASSEMVMLRNGLVFVAVSSGILVALLDGPVSLVSSATAIVLFLRALITALGVYCLEVQTGMTTSSIFPVILIAARLAITMLCLAAQIRREKSCLLRYLSRLPLKQTHEQALDSTVFFEGNKYLLLAVKMGSVNPSDLPFNLRERILSAVHVLPESLTGAIWPGCVLLGLEMCFQSCAGMQSALMALLAHTQWNQTLLGSSVPAIDMRVQGSHYRVEEGRLQNRSLDSNGPSITWVEMRALSPDCAALSITLSRLGTNNFRVMLLCGGRYYDLQVLARTAAGSPGLMTVVVRCPEAVQEGMGWLEVLLDTDDGSLAASGASPLLFTSVHEVAEELNRVLPERFPDDNHEGVAGVLGDIAKSLHGGVPASSRLLLGLARFGMAECFKNLATSRSALRAADEQGQGLLGTAVLSGSEEMVEMVISTLDNHGLPVDPCKRSPDARGYTALHWAADAVDLALVYILLAEVPNPRECWEGCQARLCGKTPAELYGEVHPLYELQFEWLEEPEAEAGAGHDFLQGGSPATTSLLTDPEARAVWGSDLAASIWAYPVSIHLSMLAVYAAMCVQLGWDDPLAWWTVVLVCTVLHVLVPYIYYRVYLKGLENVRSVAAEQGLAVSWALQFLGAPRMQEMYEQFAARRASERLFSSMLFTALPITVFTLPAAGMFEEWGLWRYTPGAVGCGVLLPLLGFAIYTGRVAWWRWLEPAIVLYCLVMITLPRSYGMMNLGNPDNCVVPSGLVTSASAGDHLMLLLQPTATPFLLSCFFSLIPKAPGAPFHWRSEVVIVLFAVLVTAPATQRCVTHLTGVDIADNFGNVCRVTIGAIWRLLKLGFRLWGEEKTITAFLTTGDVQKALGEKAF